MGPLAHAKFHANRWFPADFSTFLNFYRNFAKIVVPHSNKSENYLAYLKAYVKNNWKQHQNRPINSDMEPAQTIYPSNEQRAGLAAWQKKIQTPHFRTYSRRALFDLPKLCTVIEDVESIKIGANQLFDPKHSFSYRVQGKFWVNDWCAVSQQ